MKTLAALCYLPLLAWPAAAHAVERNFAGSVQLDYHFVPTEEKARPGGIDGFTTEAAFKVVADVTEKLSAHAKVCYGCHGFELPMAYVDYRLFDQLNFRAGRFSPSFGAFNLRHDPANHALSSKPLPYDMGRMRRSDEWNMGVLPSPFPDNGVEIGGTHWFGNRAQLDYAAYAVIGFKATPGSMDLAWSSSLAGLASLDNNSRPAVGARLALTVRLGAESDVTVGASGMYGTYDDDNNLTYTILGGDLSLRLASTHVRLEYLMRLHEFQALPDQQLVLSQPESGRETIAKHGAYVEVVQPATSWLDLVGRVDGLHRRGNALVDGPLGPRSTIVRYTLGTFLSITDGFRLKTSGELWAFSDTLGGKPEYEVGIHLAAVGTF